MQPLYAFVCRRDFRTRRVSPAIYLIPLPLSVRRWSHTQNQNPKMSSPSHRRQRSSQSGTPKRTSRKSSQPVPSPSLDPSAAQLLGEASSSQAGSQGTPRNAPLSSSPMFFRSSPANGAATGRNADINSPLRQQVTNDLVMSDGGDRTPRPSGLLIGGMFTFISVHNFILMPYRFFTNSLCLELKPWWSRASRSPSNRPS